MPPYQDDTSEDQENQPGIALIEEAIGKDIIHVFGGGKSKRDDSSVNDSIQNGVEFLAKNEENNQDRETFKAFFNERSDQGTGGYLCCEFRPGE